MLIWKKIVFIFLFFLQQANFLVTCEEQLARIISNYCKGNLNEEDKKHNDKMNASISFIPLDLKINGNIIINSDEKNQSIQGDFLKSIEGINESNSN